jgi:hypothetical protein
MLSTKSGNELLVVQLLLNLSQVINQQSDRDKYVKLLGLPYALLDKVAHLDLPGMFQLAGRADEYIKVSLDKDLFEKQLDYILTQKTEQDQEKAMLMAGAPYPMMKYLFGYTDQHYQFMRKVLGVESNGRPRHPDEEQACEIYRSWKRHYQNNLPNRFLYVHEETGASLRSVWVVVKEWELELVNYKSVKAG